MEKIYKIRTHSMLGTHHSWAVSMRGLIYHFIKKGHECYLNSINGYELCPAKWKPYLNKDIDNPDLDICYTAPKNFKDRFKEKSKLKMAIYNYETNVLPEKWLDAYKYLDYVLPSSNFSKEIFIKNGWPEEKCIVIPHGIHPEEFKNTNKQKFINDKPFKFLNVSIPHYRKNIDLVVEAYYESFYNNEDVSLIIKTDLSIPSNRRRFTFECDIMKEISNIQKRFIKDGKKNLPHIEIFQDRVDSMVSIYNSCQVLVSASSTEGFGMPLLEGLAAGLIVVAPNATGQKDFLNSNNSLLVEVTEKLAGPKYQYWSVSDKATTYFPNKDDLANQMLNAYKNYNNLKQDFKLETERVVKEFTWENAANKIIGMIE